FMNQTVEFEQVNKTVQGIFKGIGDDGRINILTEQGLIGLYQGRLRLKK
ncbi:UNVERIFIED_CONTAM: biotin--[acetyl-CoA-carboxylase] ligase, partial [Salmonella enterica subsp. enterica serovar Weltevreden]